MGPTPEHASTDDDVMLRALVQLTETQNDRIEGLRRAVVNLQSQLQARQDLELLLAHEVRTPLAGLTAILLALEDEVPADARRELVARSMAQIDHLVAVVDDLLAPRDPGTPLFPRATLRVVELRAIVDQAVEAVRARYPGLHVEVDVADVVVATAPSRAVGVLVGLLENAVSHGKAAVRPAEVTATADGADVVVEIGDRGPGVPAGVDLDQLFAPFARGRGAGDVQGRGVGLYVARELARSLGGEVTIEPRPGGGALARFHVPQRRAEDPLTAKAATGGASR